jgi:hypothetical protein
MYYILGTFDNNQILIIMKKLGLMDKNNGKNFYKA